MLKQIDGILDSYKGTSGALIPVLQIAQKMFGYLPEAQEAKLLRDIVRRDCGKRLLVPVAAAIVKVLSVARAKAATGELIGAPSLRGASAFATAIAFGVPVARAYTSSIVLAAPAESAEELRQIFAAHWPADLTDSNAPAFAV
jgi:hypothetical protein